MDAAGLKGYSGGGAPIVGEDGTALGEHGLLVVVFCDGAAQGFEIRLNAAGGFLVADEFFSKTLGQDVFGQIVAGGAQAPGGNDDVRSGFCQLYGRFQEIGRASCRERV